MKMAVVKNSDDTNGVSNVIEVMARYAAEATKNPEWCNGIYPYEMVFDELILSLYDNEHYYEAIKLAVLVFYMDGEIAAGEIASSMIAGSDEERKMFLKKFIMHANIRNDYALFIDTLTEEGEMKWHM